MVEIIEYALALAVSSIFAVASVAVFNSYSSSSQVIEGRAAFASLTDLVAQAEAVGSSHAAMAFPNSLVSCSSGTLTFVSSGETASARIAVSCDFSFEIPAGIHDFTLIVGRAGLSLKVF